MTTTDPKVVLIESFFDCLNTKNIDRLSTLYQNDSIYYDQLYGMLQGADVLRRWEILLHEDTIHSVQRIKIDIVDDEYITATWRLQCLSSLSNKELDLVITSFFRIMNQAIAEQSDAYKLSNVAGQVYGIWGKLLGWTAFMKRRLQKKAAKQL